MELGGNPSATNSGGQNPTSGSVMIDGVASTNALASSTIYPTKMSVNTKAVFNCSVYWNGTNNVDITIPHGLGVVPTMIWVKILLEVVIDGKYGIINLVLMVLLKLKT